MAYERRVEVVLVNYQRPRNIPDIVRAFREKTVPCHISLVDTAAGPEFEIDPEVRAAVDNVYSLNHNFGPYSRYVPIASFTHEFTYFHDDDMLPGCRVIEHFLKAADSLQQFGVIGQQGHHVALDGTYHAKGIVRSDHFVPADIVVRGYFVRTANLPALIEHRHNMGLIPDTNLENDLLLCTAMNMIHGLTNYLTPRDADIESLMNKSELTAAFSTYVRRNHRSDRTDACRRAIAAGWIPLSRRNSSDKSEPGNNSTPQKRRSRTMGRQKVFGLGLSKTGTQSLAVALNTLGIKTIHHPMDGKTLDELKNGEYRLSILNTYDGAVDTPIPPYYAQLDMVYPGSKFILTTRNKISWLRSVEDHWARVKEERGKNPQIDKVREFISAIVYGIIDFNPHRFSYVYDTHERDVRQYFEDRPDDLLILDIPGGDGWEKLCEFLKLEIPQIPFPHKNRGRIGDHHHVSRDSKPRNILTSAPARRDFDVNAYWLKRGKTYIGEKRLFTEPYLLQE